MHACVRVCVRACVGGCVRAPMCVLLTAQARPAKSTLKCKVPSGFGVEEMQLSGLCSRDVNGYLECDLVAYSIPSGL